MSFIDQCRTHDGVFSSTHGGEKSLYGTLYALSLKYYLTGETILSKAHKEFLLSCQDKQSGYFVGPETDGFEPDENAKHNLEHIRMHLTSAALPVIELFQSRAEYSLTFAHPFIDISFLDEWLSKRNWEDAWLNSKPHKIVIAPQRWFADRNKNIKTTDLVPDRWLRL
ncbi:MAG: hypothetical protein GY808_14060 [Gammaproteobacteria bacterium]|nr:hypothetical protein [Gammaproteobacteria bacterium]